MKSDYLIKKSLIDNEEKVNACIIILSRNNELNQLITTILNFEEKFNSKFNYDYVILNDESFTKEFEKAILKVTKSVVKFGLIPKEHWSYPSFINKTKASETRKKMSNIIYGESESYRFMCRYFSGFFFRHPLTLDYDYYWRVEPNVEFTCDINYDPFLFLKNRGILYGFTITLKEIEETIASLWNTTLSFVNKNRDLFLNRENNLDFIKTKENEYNMCHFWSNFEIASFKYLRSEEYLKYFDYLDKSGGFFYERWGDAPIHTIALSMLYPKEKVHFFNDIGYIHSGFQNCPSFDQLSNNCACPSGLNNFANLYSNECLDTWYKINNN